MKFARIKILLVIFSIISIFHLPSLLNTSEVEEQDKIQIYDLNDSNFESHVDNGYNNPWLIIFSIDSCPYCRNAKIHLENISMNPDSISNSNIRLARLDCDSNIFACYRFKISRVPYIVIIDSNKMFELNEYPSYDNIVRFINSKKDYDQGLEIPPNMGYLELAYKSLEDVILLLNSTIEGYLRNNLNMNIDWKSEYTIMLMLFILGITVVIEIWILNRIFKKHTKVVQNKCIERAKNNGDNDKEELNKEKNENNKVTEKVEEIKNDEPSNETDSEKKNKED